MVDEAVYVAKDADSASSPGEGWRGLGISSKQVGGWSGTSSPRAPRGESGPRGAEEDVRVWGVIVQEVLGWSRGYGGGVGEPLRRRERGLLFVMS